MHTIFNISQKPRKFVARKLLTPRRNQENIPEMFVDAGVHASIFLGIQTAHSMCSVTQSCSSLWAHGLWPTRLLRPWYFPSKNTEASCHLLLQGIFPTQGLNPGLPHCRQTLYRLSHDLGDAKCTMVSPDFSPDVTHPTPPPFLQVAPRSQLLVSPQGAGAPFLFSIPDLPRSQKWRVLGLSSRLPFLLYLHSLLG